LDFAGSSNPQRTKQRRERRTGKGTFSLEILSDRNATATATRFWFFLFFFHTFSLPLQCAFQFFFSRFGDLFCCYFHAFLMFFSCFCFLIESKSLFSMGFLVVSFYSHLSRFCAYFSSLDHVVCCNCLFDLSGLRSNLHACYSRNPAFKFLSYRFSTGTGQNTFKVVFFFSK